MNINNIQFDKNSELKILEQKRGLDFLKNNKTKIEKESEFELENESDSVKMISDTKSNSNNSSNNINVSKGKEEKENKVINIININKNINPNENSEIFSDLKCNNEDIILQTKNNEKILNIQSKNNINNSIIKNNYFKITNINPEEKNNNINTFNTKEDSTLNNSENNNEIKVLKNNKAVYVNSYLLNLPASSKNLKKLNKIAFIGRSKRSSRFRGVSKNGNQWQVLMMHKKGKSYIGSYSSEEYAARIYDFLVIKYRGVKARTNFKYTFEQIKKIGNMDIDVKSKDISDIIAGLT